MRRIIRLIFVLLILVLGLVFAVLNADIVYLDYYFGAVPLPLSLILVLALAVGALFGVLACLGRILHLKGEVSRLRKAVEISESEVMNLRTLPLKDTQ